jgi:hypothetical protein
MGAFVGEDYTYEQKNLGNRDRVLSLINPERMSRYADVVSARMKPPLNPL